MDKKMVEENFVAAVDTAEFNKSLKELREFSSQLYHAADYCKTTFLSSKDKTQILETTKEYVSRAVVVVVDHLGSISANLECCISKSNSFSETECKLERLMQRIGMCQNYSYKISLHRFHWAADFSRYHCRYVSPPPNDSTVSSAVPCYSKSCIEAKKEEEEEEECVELLNLDAYDFKPPVVESSSNETKKKTNADPPRLKSSIVYENLLPFDDGLSTLPKTKNSVFQFQANEKLKRSTINWKAMVQNKEMIATIIKRGKRLLA